MRAGLPIPSFSVYSFSTYIVSTLVVSALIVWIFFVWIFIVPVFTVSICHSLLVVPVPIAVAAPVEPGFPSPAAGVEEPPNDGLDDELARRLERGRALLRQRRMRLGVQELRGLLANHPDSDVAPAARESLAREGFGLHSQLVLRDARRILPRLDRDRSHFVRRIEEIHSRLDLFFRQTYSETHGQEFQLVVLDSPARFRKEFPRARRRSACESLDTGWTNFPRGRVTVFWDARIASVNGQDALDVLFENAAREMARTLLLRYTPRRRLPETIEVGLSEYLALRLFPRPLVGVARKPEGLVQGVARDALPGLEDLSDFRSHWRRGPPDEKQGVRAYGRWAAISYSLVDFLLHGSMPPDSESTAPAVPPREPRNSQLQDLLRDYERMKLKKGEKAPTREDHASSFLEVVERHFRLDLPSFHRAWLAHVLHYPRLAVDFDLFSEY